MKFNKRLFKGVAKMLIVPTIIASIFLYGYNNSSWSLNNSSKKNDEAVERAVRKIIEESNNRKALDINIDKVNANTNVQTSDSTKTKKLREIHGEIRGTWIATAYAIDFPKVKYNVDAQKAEIDAILDNVVDKGFNTIFFQVRPFADAFYKSDINPWSSYLTGTLDKDPKWDPLEYIIYAGHQRGLDIHAWINPFRVSSKLTNLDSFLNNLPDGHIAKNKELILRNKTVNDKKQTVEEAYLNPKMLQVKEHVLSTVKEIATNYPMLDGIHMDDYFYPERYPLPEGEGPEGAEATLRREAVTDIVRSIYETIKSTNKNLIFSISPFAVNKNSDMGTNAGLENYYHLFADVETWVKNNMLDLVIPQDYFEKGHKLVDFTVVSQYWDNLVEGTNVKLAIGHQIDSKTKKAVINEIDEQIQDSRALKNSIGSAIYGYGELDLIKDKLDDVYK